MIFQLKKLISREKRLVIGFFMVLFTAMVYVFYWLPIQAWSQNEKTQLTKNILTQQRMIAHARQNGFQLLVIFQGDLRKQLTADAAHRGIIIEKLEGDNRELHFQLPTLPALTLWQWLAELESRRGIYVTAITVQKESAGVSIPYIALRPRMEEK